MPRSKKLALNEEKATCCVGQNNKIVYALLAVLIVFSVYLFLKVNSLEKKLASGGGAGTAQVQQASPLEIPKLKEYAKQLKLDTGKFNNCLDSGAKAKQITADTQYGSSLGVQGTPGFFINGRFLAGAFPFAMFKEIIDKEIAGTGSDNCADYSTDLQKYCSDPQNKAFEPVAKQLNVDNMQMTGAADAKVTVVEFSDFQCPYCIRAYPTIEQVLKDYKGQVKLYYKQFPLVQIHPFAQKAAEASLCAADQGKFWEWYNKVFTLEQTSQ